MKLRSISSLILGFLLMSLALPVFAQETESGESEEVSDLSVEEVLDEPIEEEEELAVISVDAPLRVGKITLFDASSSILPEEYETVLYTWFFGDGNSDQGDNVFHAYDDTGEYTVTLQVTIDGELYAETSTDIFVYSRFYVLITDEADEQEKIESLVAFALELGVYVDVISYFDSNSEFIVEEELLQFLNESLSTLEETENFIVWTRGSTGLTLLSRFSISRINPTIFGGKNFLVITDQNFSTIQNIAEGTYNIIDPARMILTRSEALWTFFEQDDLDEFVEELASRGIQYVEITGERELTLFNFMSFLVNYMVEKGVPSNSLLLILMLPVIVTIVAFLKQVVGLTTMGVYTPSIITLSFVALGIKFGLMIFIVILLFGSLSRIFLRRYRLLYIPRMAIVLTIVSLTILVMLLVGAYFDISQLVSISIFPMLIMSTMVEKFVNAQSQRGFVQAFGMIGSTTFVSIVCYYVVEWAFLKTVIFGHPEIIFLFLLVNIFLGRWTGLRILEYVRFREIFRYSEE